MRTLWWPVTTAVVMLLAAPAAAVQLVTNGGFETGSFSGWTRFGGLGQTNVNAGDAVSGSYGARFSPNSPGGIYQDLATTAGTSYAISFDLRHYANQLAPNNFITVEFGTVQLLSLTNIGVLGASSFSFTQPATGPVTQLRFTFRDNRDSPANRWSIDNISVTDITRNTAVPEPAVWALLLAGFAMVGLAVRRRAGFASVTA